MGGRRRGARPGRPGPRVLLERMCLGFRCGSRRPAVYDVAWGQDPDGMPPVAGVMSVNDTFLAGVIFLMPICRPSPHATCIRAHNPSRRFWPSVHFSGSMSGTVLHNRLPGATPPIQTFPLPGFEVLLGRYVFSSNPYTRDSVMLVLPSTQL